MGIKHQVAALTVIVLSLTAQALFALLRDCIAIIQPEVPESGCSAARESDPSRGIRPGTVGAAGKRKGPDPRRPTGAVPYHQLMVPLCSGW